MARVVTAGSGPSIIDVMEDKRLLQSFFEPGSTWESWKVCLSAAFGLPPPKGKEAAWLEFFRKHTQRQDWPTKQSSEIWLPIGVRGGKALALDTPIATPSGWMTMGEIEPGDLIYGRDGAPARVLAATPVQHGRPCFEVEFSDGSVIVADAEHEWAVEDYRSEHPERIVTTTEIHRALVSLETQPHDFLIPLLPEWRRMQLGMERRGSPSFVYVIDVRPCASVPVRCIQVENEIFLAGKAMIPTHNSRVSALMAVYLACFRDYRKYLSPGEYGTVMVVAADRKQARVVFGYIKAMIAENPRLAALMDGPGTQESLTLKNRIRIELTTANFRAIRGYTVVAAVLDEIAVWNYEGANPAGEIVTAVRSRFATIPNALLMAISSPYARIGEMWEVYDRYFGREGDTFVWQADSRSMNPTIPEEWVKKQYERDAARARAEVGGEFRTDVERFVPLEVVRQCVVSGLKVLPPSSSIPYRAFVDPSGGRGDPMVLTIGHRRDDKAIQDATLSVSPPFQPREVVKRMADFARPYGIHKVYGDRFAGEWPRDEFRQHGIDYELYSKSKSELFVDCLPHFFSETVELLDDPEVPIQFSQLERRVSPSGRELVDHPPHGHDDKANAVAGLVRLLMGESTSSCVW